MLADARAAAVEKLIASDTLSLVRNQGGVQALDEFIEVLYDAIDRALDD